MPKLVELSEALQEELLTELLRIQKFQSFEGYKIMVHVASESEIVLAARPYEDGAPMRYFKVAIAELT